MEFASDTSLSSQPSITRYLLRQSRQQLKFRAAKTKNLPTKVGNAVERDPEFMGRGKAVALEYQSDSQSEFEAKNTGPGRSASILKKIKKTRMLPIKATRKRTRKNCYSSEDDVHPKTKGKYDTVSHKQKEWDLLLRDVLFFSGKIESYNSKNTLSEFQRVLSDVQFDLFKESYLGKFVQMGKFNVQSQIVHNILCREVAQSRKDEIWVELGGKLLRFGIEEFPIITELRCIGSCNKASIKPSTGGLFDRYFAPYVSLTRQVIRH